MRDVPDWLNISSILYQYDCASRAGEKAQRIGTETDVKKNNLVLLKMPSEILRFTEKPLIDESIQEYEYHEYEPQARTNLDHAGEIIINIELQDLFTHPCESYLVFEGRFVKEDDGAYANADAVALTNNGIMYLFSNISYRLSSQEIES